MRADGALTDRDGMCGRALSGKRPLVVRGIDSQLIAPRKQAYNAGVVEWHPAGRRRRSRPATDCGDDEPTRGAPVHAATHPSANRHILMRANLLEAVAGCSKVAATC